MWLLWLEHLDVAYNRRVWHQEKLQNLIWLGLIDYERVAWAKTLAKCKNNPMRANVVKARFRTQWCSGGLFADWRGSHPQ
jgi:hypothetical protein